MTIPANVDVVLKYPGDGTDSTFPITFQTFETANIIAQVEDEDGIRHTLDLTSDFTLSSVGIPNTNALLTLVADSQDWMDGAFLATGWTLFIKFNSDAFNPLSLNNLNALSLKGIEKEFDRLSMASKAIDYKASNAIKISDVDADEGIDVNLPPLTGNEDKLLQVNPDGDGFSYGPTAEALFNAEAAAIAAAAAALVSEGEAEVAADASEAAALEAAEAAEQAQLLLFDGSVNVNDLDSPITVDQPTYGSKIVFVDAEDGNITIQFNAIATYPGGFKVQFVRTDTSSNTVTILPDGAETIDGAPNWLLPSGIAVIFSPSTTVASDWTKKFIGVTNGGGSLPASGNAGDYLENDGSEALWQSGVFAGFSARYSATLNLTSIRNALLYIFQFSYLGPLISLAASGSGTVREKGASVASTTLTATTTRRSDNIARVEFFRAGVEIAENNPANFPGGGAEVYVDSVPFSDNVSFFARATDDGTSGGPTTQQSNTVSFTFVYPYYFGTGLPGRTAAQVAAMTKDIRISTASLNKVFTTTPGQVFYFAYPASYGALTSILDENGFETFSGWTLRTENITGLDASAQSYRIYEFNNVSSGVTTNYTFIR